MSSLHGAFARSFVAFVALSATACAVLPEGDEVSEDSASEEAVEETGQDEQALSTYYTCGWGAGASYASCYCSYADSGARAATWQEAGYFAGYFTSRWGWRSKQMRVRGRCADGTYRYGAWGSSSSQASCPDGSKTVLTSCQIRIKR